MRTEAKPCQFYDCEARCEKHRPFPGSLAEARKTPLTWAFKSFSDHPLGDSAICGNWDEDFLPLFAHAPLLLDPTQMPHGRSVFAAHLTWSKTRPDTRHIRCVPARTDSSFSQKRHFCMVSTRVWWTDWRTDGPKRCFMRNWSWSTDESYLRGTLS